MQGQSYVPDSSFFSKLFGQLDLSINYLISHVVIIKKKLNYLGMHQSEDKSQTQQQYMLSSICASIVPSQSWKHNIFRDFFSFITLAGPSPMSTPRRETHPFLTFKSYDNNNKFSPVLQLHHLLLIDPRVCPYIKQILGPEMKHD